ncbi:MAG TPA: hypothetical protein VHC48_17950 [Puia sp.]|jgi:hypothetical protein|nr:hypothetical protein [Puia sp.]
MTQHSYTIAFTYLLENGKFEVNLIADVEANETRTLYLVRNFRTAHSHDRPALPDIQLKQLKGRWVHRDSEKETELSKAVGVAIEATDPHFSALSSMSSNGQEETSA